MAVLAVLAGCGSPTDATPGTQTNLHIAAWPNGKDSGESREWTLSCDPDRGSHPNPEQACMKLDDLDDPFAPTPRDAVCTEIYGGPAVAEVEGVFRGESVGARFARTDGCEIARWDRHAFLFPVKPGNP